MNAASTCMASRREWVRGFHGRGVGGLGAAGEDLLDVLPGVPGWVVGDRGLASDAFRKRIRDLVARPAIPPKRADAPVACPDRIYANGRLVENLWARPKDGRAVAIRYEKAVQYVIAVLCLEATADWLKVDKLWQALARHKRGVPLPPGLRVGTHRPARASSGISSYLEAVAAAVSGGRVGPGGRDRTGQGGGSSSSSPGRPVRGRRCGQASRAPRPRRVYGGRGQRCPSFWAGCAIPSRDFSASRISLTWTTASLSSIRKEGESCGARLSEAQEARTSRFSGMVRSGSSTTCRVSV